MMAQHNHTSAQRIAIVTGAARGIGLEIASQFIAQGCKVAMLDIDAATQNDAVKSKGWGGQALALECDVSVPAQVQRSVDAVFAQFGRIDYLINNAGIAVFKPIGETTFEEWQRVMAVNLGGAFLCTQACVPFMLRKVHTDVDKGKGAIVNIASISGLRASALRVAYGTSKAALVHLTRQQAIELGNAGIRANAVAPGPVDTAMAKAVHSADIRRDYHDTIPLNRYGTEAEIAQTVLFLCSDAASYINGQCLAADGGFDASGIGLPSLRSAAQQS